MRLTPAEQKYGLAPDRHADVTYRPDVVVVGGGADSVRSADADGLTFTLDPSAPHIADPAVGKVMVLTDQSSGRILDIQHTAAGVVVTLAPVPLGEVFKNAHLTFNVPISPDQLAIDPDPGPAGDVADNLPSGGVVSALGGTALTTDGNPEPTTATSPPTSARGALAGAPPPAVLVDASTAGSIKAMKRNALRLTSGPAQTDPPAAYLTLSGEGR